MEEVLSKIVKEAQILKLSNVTASCYSAQEIICDKSSLLKWPMHEIRLKCLAAFEQCLRTSKSSNCKLHSYAVTGLQSMLRDRMFWTVDSDDANQQIPTQLCQSIAAVITGHNEKIQLELISLLAEIASTVTSLITIETVEEVIIICNGIYQSQGTITPKLQLAMEVASNQMCYQYCNYIINDPDCDDSTGDVSTGDVFDDDILPLLSFLCDHLNQLHLSNINETSMLIKCVHCIFKSIPSQTSVINEKFVNFIWQNLCPLLVKLLSNDSINSINPKCHDVPITAPDQLKQIGRGSESISNSERTNSISKHVYSISSELVRLFGQISSLRPVLESLFHRMLLYPPVSDRIEALKFLNEFLKHPELIISISSQPVERFGKISRSKDLDLILIVIDSLEECSASSDDTIISLSVSCGVTFLSTLELISTGGGLNQFITQQINNKYIFIENADFEGFDVRNVMTKKDNEEMVNYKVLKERISGHGDECPQQCDKSEDHCSSQTDSTVEIKKEMRNIEMDLYKSKLNEILKSGSTDSNESQEKDQEKELENNLTETNHETDKSNDKQIEENETITDDEYDTASCNSRVAEETDNENDDDSLTDDTLGPNLSEIVDRLRMNEEWDQTIGESDDVIGDVIRHERENARNFINTLKRYLPTLLPLRSSIEADEAIQLFASNYCKELWSKNHNLPPHYSIVNADGIYLSTYSALLLNLKLIHSNYYSVSSNNIPLTEAQFIKGVYSDGVLVYISETFLAEVYQQVFACDILTSAGYDCHSHDNVALINLLTDIDGLNSCIPGAQQLSDYRRLEHTLAQRRDISPEEDAGRKLVRRLLTAFWDPMIQVLSSVFDAHSNKKEALTVSLDGMQIASKLCIQLGLQAKCGNLFGLLAMAASPASPASSAIPTVVPKKRKSPLTKQLFQSIRNSITNKSIAFHTSHLLSMHVLLKSSLEIGSHCPQCWKHVFQCCVAIMEMERTHFAGRVNKPLASLTSFSTLLMTKSGMKSPNDDLQLPTINEIDNMPGINTNGNPSESLDKCIHECINSSSEGDGILRGKKLDNAIELLSQIVDRLFDDAAQKLNLQSLTKFLSELCTSSREQIIMLKQMSSDVNSKLSDAVYIKCLLLTRLSDVLLRCAKSGRPLMHMMKCWNVVTPHLVEAIAIANTVGSNHLQMQCVASKSVATLHDIMGASLSLHTELPHFHFNEALFKPFETVMLLEICDTDIQELIMSSICEFVEGTTDEIRSGWRSLFGAIRAIRLPSEDEQLERLRQLRVILDIFEAFLHTDNLQIFANAALDCLLCLIRLVKDNSTIDTSQQSDLCLVGLKYLHQFASLLASMYQMPACPLFVTGKRLPSSADNAKTIEIPVFLKNSIDCKLSIDITLDQLDRPVKILHIWYMLLDGLALNIETCSSQHKSQTIELFFHMLKTLRDIPGSNFAIYCSNHILLPSLQRWLKNCSQNESDSNLLSTVKHCAGLTADLVVDYIDMLPLNSDDTYLLGIDLLLQQSLLIFIECVSNSNECHHSLVRLSCACIRHILLSGLTHFNYKQWSIVCSYISHAHEMSLSALRALVNSFHNKTTNFFGDFERIKVVSKRNTNDDCDIEQLCQIAQRVFLLDAQRCPLETDQNTNSNDGALVSIGDDRSFTLLIQDEGNTFAIKFRDLVIQLSSHHHLVQTICALLLSGCSFSMPSLSTQLQHICPKNVENALMNMEGSQICSLLSLLMITEDVTFQYDDRPGLKFLLQKLCRTRVPANLYQLSSIAWSTAFAVRFAIFTDKKYMCKHSDIIKSCEEQLNQTLSDICEHYCEWVSKSNANNGHIWLDDLSERPLFLLQSSNPFNEGDEELAKIIGGSKENASLNDAKTYNLATEQTIESVMLQYKRWKTQHSPLPPAPDGNSKRSVDSEGERSVSDTEKENTHFLIKDNDARVTLWSELIHEAIDLHLSFSNKVQFNSLIPIFLSSIETLIIYSNNRQLRQCLSDWMSRIAKIMIENVD